MHHGESCDLESGMDMPSGRVAVREALVRVMRNAAVPLVQNTACLAVATLRARKGCARIVGFDRDLESCKSVARCDSRSRVLSRQ